ncbi:DsbA family oxidoreductase [Aminobacter carboxidus]|uniref:DsbA family oxidoreductase n=1 Tax=Aminobacter carboxidus TaxID=376165 RepID=A0ABR9GV26_9HYPH|nr:DsbA family oxidoreductase [Aminobacter carboxidus]MBE1207379.1 DsbA family oxidoreductase [Aminobacter carboxidus]
MLIEIHADVLCPWSYIAKRRLEAAMAVLGDTRIGIVWRSFELSPEGGAMPGESAADMIRQWRGDAAAARIAEIMALGAAEGIRLDLENARPVNSFDAHRLIHLGAASGKADAMMERLLRAYHSEAQNIADAGVLERLGREAGLAPSSVAALLAGEAFADAVHADRRLAVERGISGVPVMVLAGQAPTSAVKPVAELVGLLQRAAASQPGG